MSQKTNYPGLNEEDVLRRVALGEVNQAIPTTTRKLSQIILDNSVTLFNLINLIIASFIIYTGSYKNLLFLGVIITNTGIGIYQELKAKKNIDSLTLLHQPKVDVIRNYHVETIFQDEVVKDDLIVIRRGQQIIVDGVIIDTEGLECDESQITGESLPIPKKVGDTMYSGSFVISGHGIMQAVHVGQESYSYKLTVEAKQDTGIYSELIQMMKKLIRLLSFVIIPVGAILMISSILNGTHLDEAILGSTAAIIGMIPEGLVLLTSVALAVGVIKLSQQNVLVQTMGSIETLARVDILCLDKTGTLTSGKLQVTEYEVIQSVTADLSFETLVGTIIYRLNEDNATGQALMSYFSEYSSDLVTTKQVPFSSARKWSAVSFANLGNFYMGAPEYLFSTFTEKQQAKMSEAMSQGLRIIAVAHNQSTELSNDLPEDLTLVGFIFLEDEVRPEAPQTLAYFRQQAVEVCIISGDHPETVSQIAARVGVSEADKKVDMTQVTDDEIPELVKHYRVFGRVSPEQKRLLVQALQDEGHVVGMTGDGVNDILALKKADCSIVMANGSDAAKGIADFVLLDSNFDSMVNVVLEGRKVINNIQRVASLYLTKTIYSMVLAAVFIFLSTSYPFQPIQLSPINALTVGIPSFFLALRPNTAPIKGKFLKNVFEPALASGFSVVIMTLITEVFGRLNQWSYAEKSTVTVWLTGIVCFVALSYIARPLSRKIQLMIGSLFAVFLIVFVYGQQIFSLVSLVNIRLMVLYLPLTLVAYPLFYSLKSIFHKLLGKLK
ncbi:magnesium-transporting ATPase [Vagococcus penaei]|uniref:Magnesium-transporting ATPase n=1 Tax=Vagococcus penaei TaxID=633807 RepID=A0A1Q2D4A8_9ENTE|nr:HAD-IC family P-type ATPase [Vagococcus penaei]AQP53212.1 magnesium-transporting ATPase [Vagococcus penaei]RSU01013.1 magnesium-transporting ATPase [Vagococcus penaei]